MKYILKLSLILVLLNSCSVNNQQNNEENQAPMDNLSFEHQLQIFESLGFKFNEGISESDLVKWTDKKFFEKNPFELLYFVLGDVQDETYKPFTDDCWHFDTEYINDQGDYVDILENMQRISKNEIQFKNLKDYLDVEEGVAWVSFDLNGDSYKWDLEVMDDWVDGAIFEKLVELTKKYNTNKKFTYLEGGQDMVIGYHSADELLKIKKVTGLDIKWM